MIAPVQTRAPALPFRSVLVTGADGFVGRVLVGRLVAMLAPGAQLTLCARSPIADAPGPVVPLDLSNDKAVADAVAAARPDLVVHLAALSSVAGSASNAAATWQVNVGGTMRLAAAIAALCAPATVLFASSAEVYGRTFNEGCLDEEAPLGPQSPYARSKAAAEAALADMLPGNVQLIVARPCNHSGPGQDARFVLPSFAEQIVAIEHGDRTPVMRVGNLESRRDFLHIDDVIDAYMALLAAAPHLPARTVFNIASGNPVTIGSLLTGLLAQSSSKIMVETDPDRMRTADVASTCLLPDRLLAATGWKPMRTHDDLLRAVLDDKRRMVGRRASR